jgi:hypothetical protein
MFLKMKQGKYFTLTKIGSIHSDEFFQYLCLEQNINGEHEAYFVNYDNLSEEEIPQLLSMLNECKSNIFVGSFYCPMHHEVLAKTISIGVTETAVLIKEK